MAEILLCNQPCRLDSLESFHGICPGHVTDLGGFGAPMLIPYRPYLLTEQPPSGEDRSILVTLNHYPPPRDFMDMAFEFGGDMAVVIAEIAAGLREQGIASTGAAVSIYSNRMEAFAASVKRYQEALFEYRDAAKSNPAARAAAEQKAVAAFQNMQKGFQNEISTITCRIHARRGTALSNSTRALNIARSSRNIVKLDVLDQVQAGNLVNFSKYGRFLGNGLAVIDFGTRVGNVHNSYKAGENWERELFIESSSFAASAVAGSFAVYGGTAIAEAALGCFLAATPAGWVLVVTGLAVAAAAGGASIYLNNQVKENSGNWYDSIMKWVNTLP